MNEVEQRSYEVTFTARYTIRADGPEQAIDRAQEAIGEAVAIGPSDDVRSAYSARKDFVAEEVKLDPKTLAEFEAWMAAHADKE